MGKTAQETPLVQHSFTGVSLGNAEHLTLYTISITFPFANLSGATISDGSSGKTTGVSTSQHPSERPRKTLSSPAFLATL